MVLWYYILWYYVHIMVLCTYYGTMYILWYYVHIMVLCTYYGTIKSTNFVQTRVARFFLVQHTKTRKKYQTTKQHIKGSQNILHT
jgi:hypothetical protein